MFLKICKTLVTRHFLLVLPKFFLFELLTLVLAISKIIQSPAACCYVTSTCEICVYQWCWLKLQPNKTLIPNCPHGSSSGDYAGAKTTSTQAFPRGHVIFQKCIICAILNDANQYFYEVKQCQKNNWIQKMDRVNSSLSYMYVFVLY